MALSALDDKSQVPTESDLAVVLGPAKKLWDEVCEVLASEFSPLTRKWSYSGKPWGWSLALKRKKRIMVYLTPSEAFFYAGFALGEKAVVAARQSGLPPSVLQVIETSRKYAEGRGVRLEVRSAEDIGHVLKVAAAKMSS